MGVLSSSAMTDVILNALWQTLYMVFWSTLISIVIGFFPAIVLTLTAPDGLHPNKIIYETLSFIVNVFRSFPFLILLVLIIPFTRMIVGKSIGLPAFWELFACLLGGGLFGIIGLIIGVPMFAVVYTLVRQLVLERLDERANDGELTPEFLSETLGVSGNIEDSGLFRDDESDSPYLQHLILLEDIAQNPDAKEGESGV